MKRLIRRVIRVLLWLLIIAAFIAAAALIFVKAYPAFGGRPGKADIAAYSARAVNMKGGAFIYPDEYLLPGRDSNEIVSRKGKTPLETLPVGTPGIRPEPEEDKVYITWLGHSTLLVQMHSMNILIDPVFSQRSSPVSFAGPARFQPSPVSIDELPHIDILILSHDHYDHLDMRTIQALDAQVDMFVAPLGVEKHLERWGVAAEKISVMAWWEELDVNGLTIACTPTRHYSGRLRLGSNETLFASWVLKDGHHQIYESGDSGFGAHFSDIHARYGDFDLVMIDSAQYNMQWHTSHMFPEESVDACLMLGAKMAMPIHWGAYSLAPHPWDDPAVRFTAAAEAVSLPVVTPRIGATMDIDFPEAHREKWWESVQ